MPQTLIRVRQYKSSYHIDLRNPPDGAMSLGTFSSHVSTETRMIAFLLVLAWDETGCEAL